MFNMDTLDDDPSQSLNQNVLVPLKLDAFVFNAEVCDGIPPDVPKDGDAKGVMPTAAKIAPIEQPNYTFLRLNSDLIQPDIQNSVDLYNSWPSEYNSRYTSLGPEKPHPRRTGVYLHWTLPRMFRSGIAAAGKKTTTSDDFARHRSARGLQSPHLGEGPTATPSKTPAKTVDHAPPVFPSVPNRWLVIRHIPDRSTVLPQHAKVPEFAGWVIESDRLRTLRDFDLEENAGKNPIDLQTDVSPFIAASGKAHSSSFGKDDTVSKQAEVFIGMKTPLQDWTEKYAPTSSGFCTRTGNEVKAGTNQATVADDPVTAKFLPHFSLLTSSNPMFADYQPHNSNVFSMCDTFQYDGDKCLEQATAHYYVVGWYADPKDDMLSGALLGEVDSLKRQEKLDALKLKIKLETADGKQARDEDVSNMFQAWLQDQSKTRIVCHGTMYEVNWSLKKPSHVPADAFATQLNSTLPLAVGTTPLDAMTTYVRAHTSLAPRSNGTKDDVTVPQLETWIAELERHLLARDDGVETQNQASDLLYTWNYARSDGGQTWNAAGMDGKSDQKPGGTPTALIATLRELNKQQSYLDATERAMIGLQRDMFSLWWRCVTDSHPSEKSNKAYADEAEQLETKYNKLKAKKGDCKKAIDKKADLKTMQPGARPAFYQQQDPTLLVGGVSSGWQYDYLDDLLVRLDSQTLAADSGTKQKTGPLTYWQAESSWDDFDASFGAKFPPPLRKTIKALVEEFHVLEPKAKIMRSRGNTDAGPGFHVQAKYSSAPLYHDQFSAGNPRHYEPNTPAPKSAPLEWRDRWNDRQPWFPLFLEWEVEYYHIPFETWDLSRRTSRSSTLKQLRYNIPGTNDLSQLAGGNPDRHTIEGRVLLLPQPSFSLGAKIEQLFAGTPKPMLDHKTGDRWDYLKPEDRASLQRELYQLAFLSAPLSGLTAHLTTLLQGNHIKPNMRNAITGALDPIQEALRDDAGLTDARMRIIDIETDSTPFATYKGQPEEGAKSLFKPATHGQFRFKRLNIIDKFGQSIHAITPTAKELGEPVWPCISEWYAPQLKDGTTKPNVVEERKITKKSSSKVGAAPLGKQEESPSGSVPEPCEFVQIPPMINQFARLNASFVVRAGSEVDDKSNNSRSSSLANLPKSPLWRPADEWDNPIWGWVLINYANQGIQLFTKDGRFYREVRFGGPNGTQSQPAWLPFSPPDEDKIAMRATVAAEGAPGAPSDETLQLEKLAARLGDEVFMHAFWVMITKATDRMPPAPESYADFTNAALVGRPLALAHAGWSLELSRDQLVSRATNDHDPDRKLVVEPRKGHEDEDENSDADDNANPAQYAFKVAIGDTERGFDGLVGVFGCDKSVSPGEMTDLGVKLDTIYSDYYNLCDDGAALPCPPPPPRDKKGRIVIAPSRPLVLRPFYPSPSQATSANEYAAMRNSRLSVRAVLLDPFSPVHAYSGLFPVKELMLAPWTWQAPLDKMRAFFHSGPVVLTRDVPGTFDKERELSADDPLVKVPDVKKGEGAVTVPGLSKPDWVWLQPYYDPNGDRQKAEKGDGFEKALERFMVLPTGPIDDQARFEEGPYTMVEGYLLRVGGSPKTGV